jgi:hypothetical protein
MMYRILLIALLFSAHLIQAQAEEPAKLTQAMNLLAGTRIGAQELDQAKALHIPIIAGAVSKTDVTATRGFNGNNEETLTFQTQVLISQDKEVVFQTLDLAHELVHATHAKKNPFDPNLNLATYLKSGIEGEGGEAQAIAAECEAGQELIDQNSKTNALKQETVQMIKARCQFVWNTVAQDSKWKRSFYKLGNYYRNFLSQVAGLNIDEKEKAEWRDKVDAKSPMFASAVAHKPYPLALLEEYVAVTRQVCEKAKNKSVNRAIASLSLLKERCQTVGTDLGL